ncbi:transglycosylase SLT domain-containing protein [Falsiroseomonas sp. CW058]|uniref:transglycosylase SLT domain-containing protein n=1 Tax=Falsiroseomonas sp. CW058 TaxID=3388664 RepID=UPI003D320B39
MTRSRLAGAARPMAACLALGLLAACGSTPHRPATHPVSSSNGDWQRPSSYDPPGPSHDPWGPYIAQASRRFDVPERWIREVMRQESGGRQSATSRVGAMGLMQVMPGTYAELSRRYALGGDPYHPWDNIMAGTAYVREMYELYGSPAFLAAYNAGPRRLEDYLWGNRGLPDETRNYVARIGPRIQGASPSRRAAPEVYAAAEIPLNIPRGPRQGDTATMLALREQRQAVDPGIRLAQLPPGPVVRMEPIPDGSTFASTALGIAPAEAPRVQVASAGPVVAMAPVTSPGDFQSRMDPIESPGDRAPPAGSPSRMDPVVSAGDPGTIRTETLFSPPPAAPPSMPFGRATPPAAAPAQRPVALAAAPAARGFSLVPQAQASTLPVVARGLAGPQAGGNWGIQVGAFASENLARAAAGQARDTVGASGIRTAVEATGQGNARLFRARVVGLSTRSAAEQACDRLRGRGACMIVSPGA